MNLRQARIDIAAIQHNYRKVTELAPNAHVIAMIKSDAYGHGLIRVAKALPQADAFGVSAIEEALSLRHHGITQRILLMTGVQSDDELAECVAQNIDIVVHAAWHLDLLAALPQSHSISVWLKCDVGMHRLGFTEDEVDAIYQRLLQLPSVRGPIQLMAHLPNADELNNPLTAQQIASFQTIVDRYQQPASVAKSAGVMAWPSSHQQWIRPGIMLYGISPIAGETGQMRGLKPAMHFSSKLISVRHLKKGDRIGYGGDFICPEDMPIGVVGVGYSDGYPRHAATGTPMLVRGMACSLVGRVCMDMICVDLRPCPDAAIGDIVTLWGEGLPVEVIATYADTIAYELICRVSARVKTD